MSGFQTITVPYSAIDRQVWFAVQHFVRRMDEMKERREAAQAHAIEQYKQATDEARRDTQLYYDTKGKKGCLTMTMPPSLFSSAERWLLDAKRLASIPETTESLTFTAEEWMQIEQFRQGFFLQRVLEAEEARLKKEGF